MSADRALGKQLEVALRAAGGEVDARATLDELGRRVEAALVVVHVANDDVATATRALLDRLAGDTRLIAILPRANLAAVVALMQASERVAGMLVADGHAPPQLSAMATRVLAGELFGLEQLVPWGTHVHDARAADYEDKSACIATVSAFAEAMGVRRKYREAIEQCLDELLMNALYDAPVDARGRQLHANIPAKARRSLPEAHRAVVRYASDGQRFTVSVRDPFGGLERETVLRYLHKCLHAERQIDRKAGGAGLGLYLIRARRPRCTFTYSPASPPRRCACSTSRSRSCS